MSDPRTIFTSVTPEARSKISPENFTLTMNYGKQAISREFVRSDRCCGGGREECLEWVGRVATKSAASGTTNQIFALAARSRGPLLLFICKAGLNYGGGKGGDDGSGSCGPGRTIVLLADRKHHCATTARAVATI